MKLPNKTDITFSQFAELWISVHMAGRAADQVQRARRTLMRHLVRIGNEKLSLLTQVSLDRELNEIAKESSYDTANRTRQMLVRVFDYAIELKVVKSNPAKAVETPDLDRGGHAPSETLDVGVLFDVYNGIDDCEAFRAVRAAMKLSILLFQKTGHIQSMRWCDVHLNESTKKGQWIIPVGQTVTGKPHVVQLCSYTYAILKNLRDYTGGYTFVFPSPANTERCISNNAVRKAALGMGYAGMCSSSIRSAVKRHFIEQGGRKMFIDAVMGLTLHEDFPRDIDFDALSHDVMDWWAREIVIGAAQCHLPRSVVMG